MTQTEKRALPERRGRYEDGFRVLQGRREYVTYPDDSSFRIWYSDVPWTYEPHFHTAVEIILPLEGSVDYTVDGRMYSVQKGEVLIVPPESLHELTMGSGSSRYLYLFEPDAILGMRDIRVFQNGFNRVFYLRDGSEAHVRIRELLLKATEAYKKGDLMWNTFCYSCLMRVYALLGQEYLAASIRRRGQAQHVESEVIAAAMNYINSHYQEDLSLDDVAAFSGFSRFYFSRSFKKQTGCSFKDFLSQKRLQVAAELLTHTDLPMKEVAEQSGFGSAATFNRVFRESKGCTPSRYRLIYGET